MLIYFPVRLTKRRRKQQQQEQHQPIARIKLQQWRPQKQTKKEKLVFDYIFLIFIHL